MIASTTTRGLLACLLGLWVGVGSGCSLARGAVAIAENEARERGAAPPSGGLSGAAVADPDAARGHGADARATQSRYVVSPALTWGELQFYRPHAITGSLFDYSPRRECQASGLGAFELTGVPDGSAAQHVVRKEHVGFGAAGAIVPIESIFTTDADVMADRMMRSGAYMVQRGPVCFQSLYLSFHFGERSRSEHW